MGLLSPFWMHRWQRAMVALTCLLAAPAAGAGPESPPTTLTIATLSSELPVMTVRPRPKPQRAPLPEDMPAAERAKPFDPPETPALTDSSSAITAPPPRPTRKPDQLLIVDAPPPAEATAIAAPPVPVPAQGISDQPTPLPATTSAEFVPALRLADEPQQLSSDRPQEFGTQELVFGLKINQTPVELFVVVQSVDNRLYLPLGGLAQAIEFPITVDPSARRADGWFRRESNTVKIIDTASRVNGISTTLKEGDTALFRADDIYIAQSLIEAWFGMTFEANGRDMLLTVKTEQPLPFEEKIIRQRKLKLLQAQQPVTPKVLQTIGLPYLVKDIPYVDVNTYTSHDTRTTSGLASTYTVLSKGDLARHTTEVFVAGDLADEALAEARITMGRKDESRQLLGLMKASSYSFGDVTGNNLALVANSTRGRGATISNRSLYRAEQFDTTSFRGTATPGWDVELYRNDSLLSIATVGENSQYEFLNIPLFYGRNLFRIVLYGPQGQIKEETREFYAGSTLLDPGDVSYSLSVTDNEHSIFSLSDSISSTSGMRAVGELEFGATKWLTLASGLAQLEQEDGTHQYVTAGLRSSYGPLLASADAAYDFSDQTSAAKVSAATTVLGVDVRAQQIFYNGLVSDENRDTDDLLDRSTTIDLNTDLYLFSRTPFSLGLGASQKTYTDGADTTILRGRISRSLFGFSVSNSLEKSISTSETLRGTAALRGSVGRVLLGTSADYSVEPQSQINLLKFSAQFRPVSHMLNRTELQIDAQDNYEVRNTLSMDFKKYNVSFLSGGTSENDYFVGLGLNFSFTRLPLSKRWHFQSQPMADSDGAVMRAYLDSNNDLAFNEGESLLPDAQFRRDNAPIRTREDDLTYTTGLTADRPAHIIFDDNGGDPLLAPVVEGYEFIPRAGRTAVLDFPVYETAQLDGTISQSLGKLSQPLARVKVELMAQDGSTVRATTTEFDGYYLFENVKPGTYTVRLADPALHPETSSAQRDITLEPGKFATIDLLVEAADAPGTPAP